LAALFRKVITTDAHIIRTKEGLIISRLGNKKTVTVGLIQTALSADVATNMKKASEKVEEAAKQGAQIVCLQELYRTRYFPQEEKRDVSFLAETVPGASTDLFCGLAKKNGIVIIVPLFEKGSDGKFYNSAVTIDSDGKILGAYRKVHVPDDPFFYEKNYFEAGNSDYQTYKTRYGCIGVLICYDQWFPEPARINTLKGAQIIFYPTAIGYIKGHNNGDGDWHDA